MQFTSHATGESSTNKQPVRATRAVTSRNLRILHERAGGRQGQHAAHLVTAMAVEEAADGSPLPVVVRSEGDAVVGLCGVGVDSGDGDVAAAALQHFHHCPVT